MGAMPNLIGLLWSLLFSMVQFFLAFLGQPPDPY